jgi:hypothetical protein
MTLNIWNSAAIVLGFSLLVVALDEWVAKPWRSRRWEARAASGDKEAQELLRIARSAHVVDE